MPSVIEQKPQINIETAFFDIDRTLVTAGENKLHKGLSAILDTTCRPFAFTEVTARGAAHYQDVLVKNPELTPSNNLPIGLEYGTQLVVSSDYRDITKYSSVRHTSLSAAEQSDVVSFIGDNPVVKVAFYAHDPSQPRSVWLPSNGSSSEGFLGDRETLLRTSSVHSLARAIADGQPGMISVKIRGAGESATLPDSLVAHQTSFSGTTTFDFLPGGADKRDAVLFVMSQLGLRPESVLVAGDSYPDSGMLSIAGVQSVLVKNPKVDDRLFPPCIPRVEPDKLAEYLLQRCACR